MFQRFLCQPFGTFILESPAIEIGDWVKAHSLMTCWLNGKVGRCVGLRAERICVDFGWPIGVKALKHENVEKADGYANIEVDVKRMRVHPVLDDV